MLRAEKYQEDNTMDPRIRTSLKKCLELLTYEPTTLRVTHSTFMDQVDAIDGNPNQKEESNAFFKRYKRFESLYMEMKDVHENLMLVLENELRLEHTSLFYELTNILSIYLKQNNGMSIPYTINIKELPDQPIKNNVELSIEKTNIFSHTFNKPSVFLLESLLDKINIVELKYEQLSDPNNSVDENTCFVQEYYLDQFITNCETLKQFQ